MTLSRREFAQVAAAGCGAALLSGLALAEDAKPAESKMSAGWIDAHSHIWTTDLEKFPLADGQTRADLKPVSFTAEELLELAGKSNIKRVVLIQHKPYHGVDNSYITTSIAQFPGRFSGVACIDAEASHPEREMDRLKGLGMRGFRIRPGEGGQPHWKDSPGMRTMWEHAGKANLAICPLINPEDLTMVGDLCSLYPDTKVVIDHFARIGMTGQVDDAQLKALESLAAHKFVHVKISAYYALGAKKPPHVELLPMIRRLYEAYGPQRLMWGSDCPYQLTPPNNYADSVALVRDKLDFVKPDEREWLLRKTAESVFFT
jgi:L-fuconolactonase